MGFVSFVTGGVPPFPAINAGEKELTKVTEGSFGTFDMFCHLLSVQNRCLPVTEKGGTPPVTKLTQPTDADAGP
jgi:hypothetical protein